MPDRSPTPSPTPPAWPHCGHGTTPQDPVGCRGIHVSGYTQCLAHLDDAGRSDYLSGLCPGTDIDHRGTTITELLLDAVLAALRDPATGAPHLGVARFESVTFEGVPRFESVTFQGVPRFESAIFEGGARFGSAIFEGGARFESANFKGSVWFGSATFKGSARFVSTSFEDSAWFELATFEDKAWFVSASFEGSAWFAAASFKGVAGFGLATFKSIAGFVSATFEGMAGFGGATFKGMAQFESTTFEDMARFVSATFEGMAGFGGATFKGSAQFESTTFESDARFTLASFETVLNLGPLVCAGLVALSGAVFGGPVILAFAARRLECRRTRWSSTAELRLRHTTVDFAHAVFEYPLTLAAELDPFVLSDGQQLSEDSVFGVSDAAVRITSLRGVDAAHLVLADVDLADCLFTGTVHLDQIRLEGGCSFAAVPSRTHGRAGRFVRFTRRRALAEEHYWRASRPSAAPGWNEAVPGAGHVGPAQLAPVYRALRKAFEDNKNEPGAADFYYGEMEMRRHDRTGTTHAERGLLHGYWLLSGYGLRASRALGWLAAAVLVTLLLLMGFGLPDHDPKQKVTGTVPSGGGRVTFEIDKDDPRNPTGARFTGDRFEKALNVTLNSVVFRSADQNLTTAGTYIEMTSRLTEPVLLALAILAVRNRVKR